MQKDVCTLTFLGVLLCTPLLAIAEPLVGVLEPFYQAQQFLDPALLERGPGDKALTVIIAAQCRKDGIFASDLIPDLGSLGEKELSNPEHALRVSRAASGNGVKVVPLAISAGDDSGRHLQDFAAAFDAADKLGLRVINMSYTFKECDPNVQAAYANVLRTYPLILLVAAAGNDGADLENTEALQRCMVPQTLRAPNLLLVGALHTGQGASLSFGTRLMKGTNYGRNSVHVFADGDGEDVVSYKGTSLASPRVANAAARIADAHPHLFPQDIANIFIQTSDRSGAYKKWGIGGELNADAALKEAMRSAR